MAWAQVHWLMESVASMSSEDRQIMSQGGSSQSYRIDSFGLTLCHRPRLYWPTCQLISDPLQGAVVSQPEAGDWASFGMLTFFGVPEQ